MILFRKLFPRFREVDVTATQKEWMSIILEKFLLCKLSDLPPEIIIDWLNFVSQKEEGKSAIKCVKGIQVNRKTVILTFCSNISILEYVLDSMRI